jgi:hypothetical protein
LRNLKDFNKALFVCMGLVNAAYLSFSLLFTAGVVNGLQVHL